MLSTLSNKSHHSRWKDSEALWAVTQSGNPNLLYEALFSFAIVPKKPWALERESTIGAHGSLLRQPKKGTSEKASHNSGQWVDEDVETPWAVTSVKVEKTLAWLFSTFDITPGHQLCWGCALKRVGEDSTAIAVCEF